jgi:hypothetical protein
LANPTQRSGVGGGFVNNKIVSFHIFNRDWTKFHFVSFSMQFLSGPGNYSTKTTRIKIYHNVYHPKKIADNIRSTYRLLWGLSNMPKIWVYDIMTMRVVYPLSEHVDIFPVRLCLHSHWVHSVYLTLAFYLTSSSSSLRAE